MAFSYQGSNQMKHVNEIEAGDIGFIAYSNEVHKITVSSIADISRHGSPYEVYYCDEIDNEYFTTLYTEQEAYTCLLSHLKYAKDRCKQNIKSEKLIKTGIEYRIKEIKQRITTQEIK